MDLLSSMSIKARLIVGFGIIIIIMFILTIMGINNVNNIDKTLSEITEINSLKQRYAINYRGSVHDRAIAIRDVGIAKNKNQIDELVAEIRSLEEFYSEAESSMNTMLRNGVEFSTKEREIISRIDQIKQQALPLINQIIKDSYSGNDVTSVLLNDARPLFIRYLNTINEFIDYQETQNQHATAKATGITGGFQTLMLSLSAVALAVSLLVVYFIEKSLRCSLGGEPYEAQYKIKAFSEGDLSVDEHATHIGSVLHSLTEMIKKLRGIVQSIVVASENLSREVTSVSQSSSQILETAHRQTDLTQLTAKNIKTMQSEIDQVAELATQTKENSAKTVNFANEGKAVADATVTEIEQISRVVGTTVVQVKQLESRTKEIGNIINVISGISEQTNLLALNAAIEAARAGESGRGFAVVADEVRQLAKRTQEATAQIEAVITQVQNDTAASVQAMETTQPQVENGKQRIIKTSELLTHIEEQAQSSLNLVNQVADSTKEQVAMIGNVLEKMSDIETMSEDAMGIISNNEKASRYLDELSRELKKQVSFFRLN